MLYRGSSGEDGLGVSTRCVEQATGKTSSYECGGKADVEFKCKHAVHFTRAPHAELEGYDCHDQGGNFACHPTAMHNEVL